MSLKTISLICKDSGERIDKFLTDKLNTEYNINISRNAIKSLIINEYLKKNNTIFKDFSYKTRISDKFDIIIKDNSSVSLKPKNINLNIIYEDDDLIILNKQAGLTVHPGTGDNENTLVNALLHHCKENLSTIGGMDRPGIVHRLDKNTSGLMIIAKNDFSHLSLKKQLEDRILTRTYIAIIWGVIKPEAGFIVGNIERSKYNRLRMKMTLSDEGRYSKTNYKTLEKFGDFASMVECKLDTGRTHQIRVHFSSKKHPLIGDRIYGSNARKLKCHYNESYRNFVENFSRQALHSKSISFLHPRNGDKIHFETDLPEDIKELVSNLKSLV